jgi:cell division protein FtsB
MRKLKQIINQLRTLIIEMRIAYLNWALDNINACMIVVTRNISESSGSMRKWAHDDLLELAEDRIEVKAKIRKLENKIAEIK